MQIRDFRHIYAKIGGTDFVQFEVSDEDSENAAAKVAAGYTFQFYGYLAQNGSYIIQEFKVHTASSVIAYKYSAGTTGYAAAWTGRKDLTYALYSDAVTP